MSAPPPTVPGYEIIGELGRGGFATVYRALQLSVQREVALKVIATPLADEVVERRFRAECRTVGSLSWHPHVIVLHDAGLSGTGLPYLAMELIEDGSWGDRVRDTGPLDVATAVRVGAEVADALDEAHRAGIVHRDVKPDNVLIGRRGQSLLTDFGIATLADATRSATGAFTGTIAFSAPELLRGERAGPRSDVYSLGLTVHALLTGTTPFARTTDDSPAAVIWRVMSDAPEPLPASVPAPLAALLGAATDKDPERRPGTAAELFDALSTVGATAGRGAGAPAPTAPAPPTPAPDAQPPPVVASPPSAPPAASPPGFPPPPAFRPPTWAGPPPEPPSPSEPSDAGPRTAPALAPPPPPVPAPGATPPPAAAAEPGPAAPTGAASAPPVPADPGPGTAASGRRRRAPLALAAGVVLVLLAAATWFATRGGDERADDDRRSTTTATTEAGSTGSGGSVDSTASTTTEPDGPARCTGEVDDEQPFDPTASTVDSSGDARIGMVLDIGGVDDGSFNEGADTGLQAAADQLGVEVIYLEPDQDGSNRGDLLRQLAEDDYDLVIAVGFLFAEALGGNADGSGGIAAEFPDTRFVILDDASVEAPNVTGVVFAEEQGSYLAGVAAALRSGTGNIGFIGGVQTELIERFQAGFEAGVAATDPDAAVDARFVTQPPDFNGFADPEAARSIAADMYANDIDVVYHASGGSGTGVFEAAVEADRLAIGVDSDQYGQVDQAARACILTSVVKRIDQAVVTVVEEFLFGTLAVGPRPFDLADDGLDLATSGGQLDPFADQLAAARADIVDGRVEVPTTP